MSQNTEIVTAEGVIFPDKIVVVFVIIRPDFVYFCYLVRPEFVCVYRPLWIRVFVLSSVQNYPP